MNYSQSMFKIPYTSWKHNGCHYSPCETLLHGGGDSHRCNQCQLPGFLLLGTQWRQRHASQSLLSPIFAQSVWPLNSPTQSSEWYQTAAHHQESVKAKVSCLAYTCFLCTLSSLTDTLLWNGLSIKTTFHLLKVIYGTKKWGASWSNYKVVIKHLAREQSVAHHHLMSIGLCFTNVLKVAGHMAHPFKKSMFCFKTHGPKVNQRPKLSDGTRVMQHESTCFGFKCLSG